MREERTLYFGKRNECCFSLWSHLHKQIFYWPPSGDTDMPLFLYYFLLRYSQPMKWIDIWVKETYFSIIKLSKLLVMLLMGVTQLLTSQCLHLTYFLKKRLENNNNSTAHPAFWMMSCLNFLSKTKCVCGCCKTFHVVRLTVCFEGFREDKWH